MTSRTKNLNRKSNVRRQRDPIPWKYCFLTLICGLFLVTGFFYAARQHFSSMELGMKNARLRTQIEDLKSENRRLELNKTIATTPGEIKKSVKKMGLTNLTNMTARNVEVVKLKERVEEKSDEKKIEKVKDSKPQDNENKKSDKDNDKNKNSDKTGQTEKS